MNFQDLVIFGFIFMMILSVIFLIISFHICEKIDTNHAEILELMKSHATVELYQAETEFNNLKGALKAKKNRGPEAEGGL